MATIGAPSDSRYLGRNRRQRFSPRAMRNIAATTASVLRSRARRPARRLVRVVVRSDRRGRPPTRRAPRLEQRQLGERGEGVTVMPGGAVLAEALVMLLGAVPHV